MSAMSLRSDMIAAAEFAAREHGLEVRKATDNPIDPDLYAIVAALESLKMGLKTRLPSHLAVKYGLGSDRLRRELQKVQELSLRALVKDRLEGIKVRNIAPPVDALDHHGNLFEFDRN